MAAFEVAVAMGADGIELDVRRTLDGKPAVHHDAHLPDGRLIVQLTAAELPAHVPLLGEALAACAEVMVNIEIKNFAVEADYDPHQTMAGVVVDTAGALGIAERVVVSSFSFEAIDRVHELRADLRTAWLVLPSAHGPARMIERLATAGHHGIHPVWTMADEQMVNLAHDAGLFVNVWTVDEPDDIRRLDQLGVDGIVTNVPDIALDALGR